MENDNILGNYNYELHVLSGELGCPLLGDYEYLNFTSPYHMLLHCYSYMAS